MPYKNLIIYDAAPFLGEYQWRTVRMTWLVATAKIHGILYGIASRPM